jgi:hypothetical protein
VGTAVKNKNQKEIGELIGNKKHKLHSWYFATIGVLFVAYIWETLEHYLETGLAGERVVYWFQGVEFWPNRLISDPLMLILGYMLAKRFPVIIWPARALSLIWLLVHVFIFPHSMYLQEFLKI